MIDIQVVLPDQSDLDSYLPALASIGLALRHREPEWSVLRPPVLPRTHHIHVTSAGSERERRQLLLVDYLRAHDGERDAYAAHKAELAARFAGDRHRLAGAARDEIVPCLPNGPGW